MRFMFIVKATKDSEAGVMPPPSSKGWRVKYSGSKRSVVEGPFPGTKDLIAGYTMIQTRTREEAMEWARKFPNPSIDGKAGEIEVRQLFELEDFGPETVERFKDLNVGRKKGSRLETGHG